MSSLGERIWVGEIKCPICGAVATNDVNYSITCVECASDAISLHSDTVGERDWHARWDTDTIQVVIPAFNERDSIGEVIQALPDKILDHNVAPLVISDGSTDGTVDVALERGISVVEHVDNFGQGAALRTGFEIAQQLESDIIVTMDADGQHPVEYLEDIVAPIVNDEADFVIGSRYLGDDNSDISLTRRVGIRTFTLLLNTLTLSSLTDCTNGYRAIRTSEIERLTLTKNRFNAPEMIIEAKKKGLRVREIPITVEERQAGETKKPKLKYGTGLIKNIVSTWLR